MSQEFSHLSGKLRHQILPLLPIPTAPDAPLRRRVALPQGELAQLLNGPEPIRYLATLELLAGTVRGNHYHLAKRETVYVLSGALRLTALDLDSGERVVLDLAAGHAVFIAPRVAHALRVTAPGWGIEFAPDPLDPADTLRHALDPA